MPYAHGYHHEFALMRSNVWFENHLGSASMTIVSPGAEARGIDARGLKAKVSADLAAYLDSDSTCPPTWPRPSAGRYRREWRALRAYLDFRNDVVTGLITEIRDAVRPEVTVSVIPRCPSQRRGLVRGHRPARAFGGGPAH